MMPVQQSFTCLAFCFATVALIGCGDGGSSSPSSPTPSSSSAPPAKADIAENEPNETAPAGEVTEINPGWGHLKGRFVLDGTIPASPALQITKDPEVCGKHDLRDESLVVNKENSGVAGVLIALYVKRGDEAPEEHESYADAAATPVVLDNLNCRFEPHVCLLRTSQTLLIKNSDPVGHNTKIDTSSNPAVNQTIPNGAEMKQQFTAEERRPAPVSCSIHPWMKAWLVVQENPYFAVTDKDGSFQIENLPSGTWTFQCWHEKAKGIAEVTIAGKSQTWSKGRVDFTIQADETNDLGDIKLKPSVFE